MTTAYLEIEGEFETIDASDPKIAALIETGDLLKKDRLPWWMRLWFGDTETYYPNGRLNGFQLARLGMTKQQACMRRSGLHSVIG